MSRNATRLILIGFMGSGKSSLATALSSRFEHFDMDQLVCQEVDCQNMKDLFKRGGEALLRRAELQVARQIEKKTGCVIDTGGGVVTVAATMRALQTAKSLTIFLDTTLETVRKRLEGDSSRPLFSQAKDLYEERAPLYRKYADLVIDTNGQSTDTIAKKLLYTYGL